ncbi:MAG: DUF4347 domain-containing protein, partial [Gammaproteobacteria bacterium]|nr:DUF4347 domain-containing protein [Gammaproteobacteria bacterium]
MGKKQRQKKKRSAPLIEALEPRVLFSADVFGGALDAPGTDDPLATILNDAAAAVESARTPETLNRNPENDAKAGPVSDEDGVNPVTHGEDPPKPTEAQRHELVLVDTATPDYQQLIDDILAQSEEERTIDVVLLDASQDGISQLTQALDGYQDLDAVHLVSHGSEGAIQLGGGTLNFDSLLANSSTINGWGKVFSEDGDFLIYGCNLAASSDGQAMVDALGRLTGADVAASDDLTGNAALGGDWELEYQVGDIEADLAVSVEAQQEWSGLLGTTVHTSYEGGNGEWELKDGEDAGQSFKHTSGGGTYTVNQFSLQLRDIGSPTVDITVSLRDAWNGTVLGSGVISSSSLTSTFQWHDFDFADVDLDDNTTYVIQVEVGAGSDKIFWKYDGTSGYGDGNHNDKNGNDVGGDANFRVTEVANDAPVITSDGGGATAAINVTENTTAVTTVTATDADLDTPTFSISGGADQALFSIDINGVLTFDAAPDFENPTDSDTDNVYVVEVTADDGNGGTDVQTISATVTDANDAPNAVNDSATVYEGDVVTIDLANNDSDPDNALDLNSIVITSAPANGSLLVNGDGTVTYTHDGSNTVSDSFNYTIKDVSGETSNAASVTLTVTPTFDQSASIAENTQIVTSVSGDDGDVHVYQIVGGADAALFGFGGNPLSPTATLYFLSAPDFELPTDDNGDGIYEVIVNSDGTILNFSVTVNNVNDAPTVSATATNPTYTEGDTAVDLFN